MTFLHPALLAAGLACIAIPIIIHLLMHRRRKPVMWGAMRFLLEAYRRQRRRMMLEKWLLLACRCLLLALLALAIGRPLLGKLALGKPGKTIFILIDNSLTSGVRDHSGTTALSHHKSAAKAVLKSLRSLAGTGGGGGSEADRVGLIALGGPAEGLVVPPSANLGSVESLIDAIEPTDSRADFPGGLSLLSSALSPVEGAGQTAPRPDRTFVVLLSDYLDGSIDLAAGSSDAAQSIAGIKLPEGVRLISSTPSAETGSNISIVALEPLRSVLVDAAKTPGASADLSELVRIQLRRTGDTAQAAATTVRAHIAPLSAEADRLTVENPTERAIVRWSPGQESAIAIVPVRTDRRASNKPGAPASAVIVASIDDDALPADNRWRRPVELRDALRVGVVAPLRFGKAERIDKLDPASWARLALAPGGDSGGGGAGSGGVDVIDIEPASLDAARLAALDAVVLPRPDLIPEQAWPKLKLFIDSGGLVLVTPPSGVTVHLWGDTMTKALGLDWSVAREAQDAAGKKLRRGGSVPLPSGASPEGSASTASSLLNLVEGELDDLLSPVAVQRNLPMVPPPDSGEPLLRLDDGSIFMWAGSPTPSDAKPASPPSAHPTSDLPHPTSNGRGLLVYLSVALDLDWSDLPAKPLMVPLVQEVLRQGVGKARGNWTAIAGTRPAVPSRSTELQELPDPARPGAERDHIAGARIRIESLGASAVAEPVRRAGLWRAVDERGAMRGVIAANPDPRAGRTQIQPKDAVASILNKLTPGHVEGSPDAVAWLPPDHAIPGAPAVASIADTIAAVFGRADSGSPVSWPLLIAALALALVEIILARRASHADIAVASEPDGGVGSLSNLPVKEAA